MGNLRGKGGFTLVELVFVIAVLGILSVAAIPLFPNLATFQTDAAAKKLISDLAYARQLARTRNGTYGISFNAGTDTYTVFSYDPVTDTQTTLTDPHGGVPMVIDFTQQPGLSGIDIESPYFGVTSTVRFTPQGVPTDSTGSPLGTSGSVLLLAGGAVRTVFVEPNTGEVSYQ